MPGFWLRTAGGRVARYNIPSAVSCLRIVPFRDPHFPGASQHNAQVNYGGGVVRWLFFDARTFITSPSPGIETIDTTHDGGLASTTPVAACNLSDRPLLYNGLGVRDSNGSRPPFSSYFNGTTRYFGLDNYCPGGHPTVGFAAGAGNNSVNTSVDIYVGLYNSTTGHYSNAVKAGTIAGTAGVTGTITVSNLQGLKIQFHNAQEHTEQNYVFYATLDPGATPYLILNSALTGPFTAANNATTASLSITAPTVTNANGWILDLGLEAPELNFPPRPMGSVCFVNGRLYGTLIPGGSASNSSPDFSYVPESKDLAAVVWSMASGDSQAQSVAGDPNQSWPFTNIKYTPSSDAPIAVVPAQDGVRVLVLTPSSAFLLAEVTDGVHEYITISRRHGCASAASIVETPYGICWVTQRNEIVMLPPYNTQVIPLSRPYQSLMKGGKVTAADWVYDPDEQIDRYQVWMDNGISVIHDFAIGNAGNGALDGSGATNQTAQPYGEGYTRSTNGNVTAAATCVSGDGLSNFVIAIGAGLYTHETQYETGLIPTTDQTFVGTTQSHTSSEINGEYHRNWDAFGDSRLRKELRECTLLGDGATSSELGTSPLTVEWYADFKQVTGVNKQATTEIKAPQSDSDSQWQFKFSKFNKFWYKIVLKLAGHSTDDVSYANHVNWSQQGDLAKNFYGSILQLSTTLGNAENRP